MAAQSLLQMAGAPSHPSPLDKSVLVIIDAQLEYVTGKLPLAGVVDAIRQTRAVLDLARAQRIPVFHIRQVSPAGRPLFAEDSATVQIVPELTPKSGEAVIDKKLPNAFAGTPLVEQIKATGRGELIICGFMTHMCVSATARAALDLGFRSTVVAAAAATRDLPDPLGGVIPAQQVHRTALTELADRFAIVVPDAGAWKG